MFTVNVRYSKSILVEKQSKFLTYLVPYQFFDETLEALKTEHCKARHFVTAFRSLNQYEQIVEGSSDDGEPKGTAGKPTLSVLQGRELINVAVITVRYFGGTKLGTGGLVRAYSDVANMAVDSVELIEYQKEFQEEIAISYANVGKVEYAIEQFGLHIPAKRFDAGEAVFTIGGTRNSLDKFFHDIDRLVRRL